MRRETRRKRRERKAMTDITLTPLIDTALTLLVIFMIAAPMMRNSITIRLPKGQIKELAEDVQPIFVQVNQDGQLFFEAAVVSSSQELLARIKKEAALSHRATVVVEGDEGVSYGTIYSLIDDIKRLGVIDNVAMASRRT